MASSKHHVVYLLLLTTMAALMPVEVTGVRTMYASKFSGMGVEVNHDMENSGGVRPVRALSGGWLSKGIGLKYLSKKHKKKKTKKVSGNGKGNGKGKGKPGKNSNGPVEKFVELAHIKDGKHDYNGQGVAEMNDSTWAGDKRTYMVRKDYSFFKPGIVSLAGAVDMIDGVQCEYGQVRVRLDDERFGPNTPLEKLFPIGSLLAIHAGVWGPCNFHLPRNKSSRNSTTTTNFEGDMLRDNGLHGWLIVQSVMGSPRNIVITGTPTNSLFMFDSASFSAWPMVPMTNRRGRRELQSGTFSIQEDYSETFFDAIDLTASAELDVIVDLTFNLDVSTPTTGVDSGFFDIEIPDDIIVGLTITVSAELDFKAGVAIALKGSTIAKQEQQEPIASVGVPGAGIVIDLPLGLPTLELGAILALDALIEAEITASANLRASADLALSTGSYAATFFAGGTLAVVDTGFNFYASVQENTPPSAKVTTNVQGGPFALSANIFAGLLPQLQLTAFGNLEGGAQVKVGANVKGTAQDAPLYPLQPPAPFVINPEICNGCHLAQIELNSVVTPELDAQIDLVIFSQVVTLAILPDIAQRDVPVAQVCFFPVGCDSQSCPPSPTRPTPQPNGPNPVPALPGGFWSGVFGDPHLSTFDRLRFDCQAAGEFTMVTSLESPRGNRCCATRGQYFGSSHT
jgi:hypothetical protein